MFTETRQRSMTTSIVTQALNRDQVTQVYQGGVRRDIFPPLIEDALSPSNLGRLESMAVSDEIRGRSATRGGSNPTVWRTFSTDLATAVARCKSYIVCHRN